MTFYRGALSSDTPSLLSALQSFSYSTSKPDKTCIAYDLDALLLTFRAANTDFPGHFVHALAVRVRTS